MIEPHVNSYYVATAAKKTDYPRLKGEVSSDVCVVGAGITGISAALHLAEKGYQVTLLESNKIGWGASGRSGGQFIFGFGSEMQRLRNIVGRDVAQELWNLSLESIDLLRNLVKKHDISCDLVQGQMHAAIKPRQQTELEEWKSELETQYGYDNLELWTGSELRSKVSSERYVAGLFDKNSGHLHPLNYTLGLADAAEKAGVNIFEDSKVSKIKYGKQPEVTTRDGSVKAQHLILAGNAYLEGLAPKIKNKIMPVGTYIGATKNLGEERARSLISNNMAIADINFVLDYYRFSADYRMLFGGRVSYSTLDPPNLPIAMKARMLKVFPELENEEMEYTWGGYVGITMNRAPHFGRIGENVYFAQGFSGHGISLTGLAGKLMADAVSGTAEKLDVFEKISHYPFPGGTLLRMPALVLAMAYFRMRDFF